MSESQTKAGNQRKFEKSENCKAFFGTSAAAACELANPRAGSQLKMSESQTKAGNQSNCVSHDSRE